MKCDLQEHFRQRLKSAFKVFSSEGSEYHGFVVVSFFTIPNHQPLTLLQTPNEALDRVAMLVLLVVTGRRRPHLVVCPAVRTVASGRPGGRLPGAPWWRTRSAEPTGSYPRAGLTPESSWAVRSLFIIVWVACGGTGSLNDRAVHVKLFPVDAPFRIEFVLQMPDDFLQRAVLRPAAEAVVDRLPGAVAVGEVSPRGPTVKSRKCRSAPVGGLCTDRRDLRPPGAEVQCVHIVHWSARIDVEAYQHVGIHEQSRVTCLYKIFIRRCLVKVAGDVRTRGRPIFGYRR